jgi:redox-sensitive bicupin YhaK (pirin superfamily)
MMNQTKAKMFLADERGLNETNWFRSQHTFNFGKYFNEHKQPFGNLYVVNDEVLDAGRSLNIFIEEYCYVILLPVMGAIAFKDSSGNDNLIAAGQIQILTADKGETIDISNPFDEGLVNFLQIWIKADQMNAASGSSLSTYNVNECLNSLLKISPYNLGSSSLPFAISIGKFDGRGETIHQLKNKNAGAFAFVIEGAFEVQGRLLHARDGLALWETEEVEIEAFSNEAIILLIEIPLK